jgi:hypothetical protein
MVRARELLREIRRAGGGIRLAQDFYRPRSRVCPGMKHKPLQGTQLELFPDGDSVSERSLESQPDPARPLADLFPNAY